MKVNKVKQTDITGISLVSKPANGALICNELTGCSLQNNIVEAVVLKANDKIYRKPSNKQEERFIYWTQESLEQAAHDAYGKNIKTSINHDGKDLEDIQILESHVKDDTWLMKFKVSDEIQHQIRSGELNGVSIEGISIEEPVIDITNDVEKLMSDAMLLDEETRRNVFLD